MTQQKSNLSIDAWLTRLGRILAQDTGSQPVIGRAPLNSETGDLLWWACADPSDLFVGVNRADAESLARIRKAAANENTKDPGAAFSDLLNISLGSGEMVENEPDSSAGRDVYQVEFGTGESVRLVVLQMEPARRETTNIDMLMEIELPITLRFGSTTMALRDVAGLGSGSIIEFDRGIDDPVEVIVNGRVIARGQAVIANGSYGVRISEISSRSERLLSSTFARVPDGRVSAGEQVV